MFGRIQFLIESTEVFSFMRYANNENPYLITVNIGHNTTIMDYTEEVGVEKGEIVAHTHGTSDKDEMNHHEIDLHHMKLRPGEGIVVKLL